MDRYEFYIWVLTLMALDMVSYKKKYIIHYGCIYKYVYIYHIYVYIYILARNKVSLY